MVSAGVIVGIVIGAIVLIAAIVVVIILVLRARAKTSTTNNNNTNTNVDTKTCSSNNDCASKACNTTLGVCAECLDDTFCGGDLPKCSPGNLVCVACLDTPDCAEGYTCIKNQCCSNDPPVITDVVETISSNRSITISYTLAQKRSGAKVILKISDPESETPLGNAVEFLATDETLTVSEAQLGFKFYSSGDEEDLNWPYRLTLQVKYRCGADETQTTDESEPYDFIPGVCPDTTAAVLDPMMITGDHPYIQLLDVDNEEPDTNYKIRVTNVENAHPALDLAEFQKVTSDGPSGKKIIYFQELPPEPGTYYFRAVRIGGIGKCSGGISSVHGQASYTYL